MTDEEGGPEPVTDRAIHLDFIFAEPLTDLFSLAQLTVEFRLGRQP